MNETTVAIPLMAGALAAGYAVASLFFLRFWRQTHDRLFLLFSAAFAVLSVQRVALALVNDQSDSTPFYTLRLIAFVLILVAIIDKNRARS